MAADAPQSQIKTAKLTSPLAEVSLLNLGCITQHWQLADWPQNRSAVLGYRAATDYTNNPFFMGAIIGRVANRIENAQFLLNGKPHNLSPNQGKHTLHGGAGGISTRLWDMDTDGSTAVQFRLHSPSGDQGFPAAVDFTVTITLNGAELTYDMQASVDAPTPINMTQHSYYNLSNAATIRQHALCIPADSLVQTTDQGIPTEITPLDGLPQDFRTAKLIQNADPDSKGIDHNYCLAQGGAPAILLTSGRGETLRMHTDQPGLQVYTGASLRPHANATPTQNHAPFSGICLEPQGYPNAVNRPDFPSTIATPDTPYRQILRVCIEQDGVK